MSRRTFTENVMNLAVENYLMSDIPRILTPEEVIRITEETLRDLASESNDVIWKREFLQEQVRKLQEELKIYQQNKRREVKVPSTFTGVATLEQQEWPGAAQSLQQASTTAQTPSRSQAPAPFSRVSFEGFPVAANPSLNIPAVLTPPATPESRAKGGTPGPSSSKMARLSNSSTSHGKTLDAESHSSKSLKQRERKAYRKRSGSSSSEL